MISCRCQSRLQMRINRLVMGCQAIKQKFSISSQTCFILIQKENSWQKKQPFGELRKKIHFSAWCFLWNFLINLGAFLFRNNAKWLFLKQCLTRHSKIKIFSQQNPIRMIFQSLNRFKIMSTLSFSLISDFCHTLKTI